MDNKYCFRLYACNFEVYNKEMLLRLKRLENDNKITKWLKKSQSNTKKHEFMCVHYDNKL